MYQVLGRVYGGEQNLNTVRALMELTIEGRTEDSEAVDVRVSNGVQMAGGEGRVSGEGAPGAQRSSSRGPSLTVATAVSACAGGDDCPHDSSSSPLPPPRHPASLLHHGPPARGLSQPTFSSFNSRPWELEGHPLPSLKDFPAVLSPQ